MQKSVALLTNFFKNYLPSLSRRPGGAGAGVLVLGGLARGAAALEVGRRG